MTPFHRFPLRILKVNKSIMLIDEKCKHCFEYICMNFQPQRMVSVFVEHPVGLSIPHGRLVSEWKQNSTFLFN